jgi:glycosyltransferase involved in cell wall biosynthesis
MSIPILERGGSTAVQSSIVLDVTHTLLHTNSPPITGIERIQHEYASRLGSSPIDAAGVHFAAGKAHFISSQCMSEIATTLAGRSYSSAAEDPVFRRTVDWLNGTSGRDSVEVGGQDAPARLNFPRLRRISTIGRAMTSRTTPPVAERLFYLSIPQHGILGGFFAFRWLRRSNTRAVFFIHDLFPLDYPQFFPHGYSKQFSKHFRSIVQLAAGFIVASTAVRERLQRELKTLGRPTLPIFVFPVPPAAEYGAGFHAITNLSKHAYFVMCGTLEPRKNHIAILNLWKELARGNRTVPRLILVGKRGHQSGKILSLLKEAGELSRYVIHISGLSNAGLSGLLSGASASLVPSFDEGYGFPAVEALAVSCPVIASDIPVFREVTQNCATYCQPLDGPGWSKALMAIADRDSVEWRTCSQRASSYKPPTWNEYFYELSCFVEAMR